MEHDAHLAIHTGHKRMLKHPTYLFAYSIHFNMSSSIPAIYENISTDKAFIGEIQSNNVLFI